MIKKFSVRNFKNFKDKITLDFSKSRDYSFNSNLIKNGLVNKAIIFGYNSTGKSNLGFAIMDITSHLTDTPIAQSHYILSMNLDSNKKEMEFEYEFLFGDKNITYKYQKDKARNLLYEEIFIDGQSVFYYDYSDNSYRNDISDISNISLANRTENISVIKYIRNTAIEFKEDNPIKLIVDFANDMLWFRSLRINESMGRQPEANDISSFIVKHNLEQEFQQFLNDCDVHEDIIKLDTPSGEVLGVRKGYYNVPFFSVCSTGTACLALFFYWKKSCFHNIKFLYLDEYDAFYHEKLSMTLLQTLFNDDNFQCVITTHNSTLATNELIRPDAVMILRNNKVKALADLTNKVLREGHNLRKLMESGEFDE